DVLGKEAPARRLLCLPGRLRVEGTAARAAHLTPQEEQQALHLVAVPRMGELIAARRGKRMDQGERLGTPLDHESGEHRNDPLLSQRVDRSMAAEKTAPEQRRAGMNDGRQLHPPVLGKVRVAEV